MAFSATFNSSTGAAKPSVFDNPVPVPTTPVDSELRVLITNQLSEEVLHAIVAEGFTSVELFAALESTEAAVRSFFTNDFGLNKTLRGWRAVVAGLTVAWTAPRQRGQARARLRMPKPTWPGGPAPFPG